MISCLYSGTVRHRRFADVPHAFDYRLYLAYLDLDELPGLFDGIPFASSSRPAPIRFQRRDYFIPDAEQAAQLMQSLSASVADLSARDDDKAWQLMRSK